MEALIANVGQIFTAAIGWVGTVATTVTSNPILLLFCILPLVGLGIGMFVRLLNAR